MALTDLQKEQYQVLVSEIASMKRVVVAFSGGVDSTLLLHAAYQALGDGALAVSLVTPYSPKAEIAGARRIAEAMGASHRLVEMPIPDAIRENPPERCYLCKRSLFGKLRSIAKEEGSAFVIDGSNMDDLDDYRPGFKAVRELDVRSPLIDAGLTKQDIRDLSREHGLMTWNKPAGACLLTRLPHGVTVDETELARIDTGEDFLRSQGFPAVRLRSHGDLARIELPADAISGLLAPEVRSVIDARLRELGYRHVAVDLRGYRMGSLNEPVSDADSKE
ncbi:ATP-dependent sacrificial sulfur transferase LarE [Pseudodesulfovibrio sp.]|uniref:ATP-dependent sacrificial sulfur transferase LarE n=1 Tax=unclassified Pseudodesulfovibrio TaxID=2661612 RepID=UPI003B00A5F5